MALISTFDAPPAPARPAAAGGLSPAAAGGAACLRASLRRELRLLLRERFDALAALGFFALVLSLLPLALGGEPALLQRVAPAAAWTAALLSVLLSSLRLFQADLGNGALEQQLMAPAPLAVLGGRLLAHGLACGLLLPASALLMPLYGLPLAQWPALALSLLLGLPTLVLLCALGAALTLGSRGGGVLLALLVLPLAVPVLLLGMATAQGAPAASWLLGALMAAALALLPWTVLAALRMGMD
ncbi:heme exporter protein CcmB [Azohydromonas caseinilytica]|uniref:Heme exporter protein B n=1 Tax=Azohydromonas caseinilytica TaxID=2728836 RepID=A0A848FKT5_9BURK|nr:heme exporter protein CcmB [Azohydromonas caseinilytica]NML18411.1 heme exporter protein CcmB [Azohydromonas caseinilytica]